MEPFPVLNAAGIDYAVKLEGEGGDEVVLTVRQAGGVFPGLSDPGPVLATLRIPANDWRDLCEDVCVW